MTDITPLETLYDSASGRDVPLPETLSYLYGNLKFPTFAGRPYIISNFVSSLDGVVALRVPGHEGGGDISGFNQHDRMLMGILRSMADIVIVGAGTLRSVPDHLWTAEYIYPPLAEEYSRLRSSLGKEKSPLNVIVSASGNIDPGLRVIKSGEVPVLIVTTTQGAEQLNRQSLSPSIKVIAAAESNLLTASALLDATYRVRKSEIILVEGGPQLMGDFFAEGYLDELFLTIAPQVAGRDGGPERPGLVSGKIFAPENPLWGTLISIKRAESHLFLRYKFE